MEGRITEGRSKFACQNARRDSDIPHAQADCGNPALRHKLEHPEVILRVVGHRGDLDDVRIEGGHAIVKGLEILRRFVKIVIADDAFGLAVSGNRGRDILFQVDVVHSFGDGGPKNELPLLFSPPKPSPITFSAARHDHRAGTFVEEPLHVDRTIDVVEPNFDQLHALLRKIPMLCDHMPMASSSNADTNDTVRIGCRHGL